jgi:DNA-directed RNA polymerase subunit RPC12/RpoP
MTARETQFKCLNCGHEYKGMYDPDNITERTCPHCRSNSVRRLPEKKAAEKK